jgi:hypothetical protein
MLASITPIHTVHSSPDRHIDAGGGWTANTSTHNNSFVGMNEPAPRAHDVNSHVIPKSSFPAVGAGGSPATGEGCSGTQPAYCGYGGGADDSCKSSDLAANICAAWQDLYDALNFATNENLATVCSRTDPCNCFAGLDPHHPSVGVTCSSSDPSFDFDPPDPTQTRIVSM